mgnify:CR=1 FL=1
MNVVQLKIHDGGLTNYAGYRLGKQLNYIKIELEILFIYYINNNVIRKNQKRT